MTALPIDSMLSLLPLAADDPLLHVIDHWHEIGGVPIISNHIIMMVVAALLMLVVFLPVAKKYREDKNLVPTGRSNMVEAIMIYMRDEVVKPVLGHATAKYIALLWTLFFFILFCNLLGLLPLDSLQATWTPWYPIYGTATANIYVTGALAIVSFILIQAGGIKANGLGGYLHHFLGGAPWYMAIILVPIEILGAFVKPVALAFRLMANMAGGHLILAVLIGLGTNAYFTMDPAAGWGIAALVVVGSTAIMVLEVFIAFLHAYIFMFLTALFIGLLVVHEEHDEHEGDKAEDHYGSVDTDDDAKLPVSALQAGAHMA